MEINIAFTPNVAWASHLVAHGIAWEVNDEVLISPLEHHSIMLPWLQASKVNNLRINFFQADPSGRVNPTTIETYLTSRTRVVVVPYVSLVYGAINPISEIARLVHENNCLFVVDGTRAAGHVPIDLQKMNCDVFTCSGNIGFLGPQGVSVLYLSKRIIDDLSTYPGDGTVKSVTRYEWSLLDPPERFEPGFTNIPGVQGLKAAIGYLQRVGLNSIYIHENQLTDLLLRGLSQFEKLTFFGPQKSTERVGIIGFIIKDINPHDIALILDETGKILVRSGFLCAHPLVHPLNSEGVVQASVHCYNTREEIQKFIEHTQTIIEQLT